ncbi:MAG: magnesium transporter [Thermomicrobiales bacterium]
MDSTRGATITPLESDADQLHAALTESNEELARALVWQIDDDQAEQLFEMLSTEEVDALFRLIGNDRFADLLVRLEDQQAADVLEQFPVDRAADLLEEIDPDDAADIFSELDARLSGDILVAMEPDEADEIRELLAWPPDTAGGIMTPAFVSISPTMRADQAIAALRKVSEEAETINYVYVTDGDDNLLGVLSLHKLVLTRPHTPVGELMFTRPVTIHAAADQEKAAKTLVENDLLAIPVVDDENHILGIITVDDVAEVLEREATEDIERLGGSAPLTEPYLLASPIHIFRKRVVWLFLLFMAQFATVSVIGHYDSLLTQFTVLSFFIPILIGTGGNIGSQTVTTLIRAIGVGEVGPRHAALVFWKELRTGVMLGLVMAGLMFFRALLVGSSTTDIAVTVGCAVFVIAVWAASVGSLLPLVLVRLKVDPAVVSAPLISSLVDATGLMIYFSFATLMLDLT